MKTYNQQQATQKLMKIVGLPEFTEDIATSYVEGFFYMFGQTLVGEYDFDVMLDSAGQDGWLD